MHQDFHRLRRKHSAFSAVVAMAAMGLALLGDGGAAHAAGGTDLPNSKIADQNTAIGADASVSFTLTKTTHIEYRYVPRYTANCALITADQVAPFLAGQAYTGYVINNQNGPACGFADLPAGTYYLGMRDDTGQANSNNTCHFEVDDASGLSPADGMYYLGELINPTVINLSVNEYATNEFTIQPNTRNFLFGCNTAGMNSYIIPTSQEAAFKAGQTFTYYVDYANPGQNDEPYYEIANLPPGTYAFAVSNTTTLPGSYAFEGQVWAFNSGSGTPVTPSSLSFNPNPMIGGQSTTATITLSGPAPSGGATVTFTGPTGWTFSSVTIGAGQQSATFTINANPVTSQANVPIVASYNGGSATGTLTINPAVSVRVSGFSPTSGPVGTSVTISGSGFTGATSVAFHGVLAVSGTINSATQITAVVPTGATTGPITVTAPGGTATASVNFTVTPAPTNTHVLWNNASGALSLWNYDPATGSFTQNTYGPYAGWTAKAIADGPDGLTRVLWDNVNGQMSLWSLDNTTGNFTQNTFGPYNGWTAAAVSTAPDNTTHVLWTHPGGLMSLWNYSTATGGFSQNTYGPYAGWIAVALADGPDGLTRVLWGNPDGRSSFWSLDNSVFGGSFTQNTYGPYFGWTANTLSVGQDNTTHIVWDNSDGRLSLWNYSTATGGFTQNTYGPYSGWYARGVADGGDGLTRVLWDNGGGATSLWSLDNLTGSFTQNTFGPYSGWTADAVSAGP